MAVLCHPEPAKAVAISPGIYRLFIKAFPEVEEQEVVEKKVATI